MPNPDLKEIFKNDHKDKHPFAEVEEKSELDQPMDAEQRKTLAQKFEEGDRKLYDFIQEKTKNFPEWIPVIAPFIKWMKSEQEANHAATFHSDIRTGDKFNTMGEVLGEYGKHKLEALWNQFRTSIDILALVGTFGEGTVAEAAVGATAKAAAGQVAKEVAVSTVAKAGETAATGAAESAASGVAKEQVVKQVEALLHKLSEANAEETILQQIPKALEKLAEKLGDEKGGEVVRVIARLFKGLVENDASRKAMVESVKNNEQWQKVKEKIKDENERREQVSEVVNSDALAKFKDIFEGKAA